jgi:phosphoribosylformylglycinamidine synthase
MGGSHYYAQHGFIGNTVPKVNAAKGKELMKALSAATSSGLVRACHDCSEGGIGVAVAEMAFAGGHGMELYLKQVPVGGPIERSDTILFSESNTRFIVEVAPEDKAQFEETMQGISFGQMGVVTSSPRLEIHGLDGRTVVSTPLADLKEAWQRPLRW